MIQSAMKRLKPIYLAYLALALLAFALVVASWVYRDDVFQSIYDPKSPFQTMTPPAAPDYTQAESWISLPDLNVDPIEYAGKGDIFVVAPTIFLGNKNWNAPLDNLGVERNFKTIVAPNYVLPFENSGRVFAPKYRQAALYSLMTARDDAKAAQRLAYDDVRRAFEVFLAENPPERPIVIVGYGQGGLHAVRLLSEEMDAKARSKLAVAYIVDYPLPLDQFQSALSAYSPCQEARQTGCIVGFGAFRPTEFRRKQFYLEKLKMWDGEALVRAGDRPLLCTNPLSWETHSAYISKKQHLGGVAAAGLEAGAVPAPTAQQTGAKCQDGILLIDRPTQKSLRRPSRFGGKYRTLESNLFYEDLRQNASERISALLDQDVLPKRAPVLELDTIEITESPITQPLEPIQR